VSKPPSNLKYCTRTTTPATAIAGSDDKRRRVYRCTDDLPGWMVASSTVGDRKSAGSPSDDRRPAVLVSDAPLLACRFHPLIDLSPGIHCTPSRTPPTAPSGKNIPGALQPSTLRSTHRAASSPRWNSDRDLLLLNLQLPLLAWSHCFAV